MDISEDSEEDTDEVDDDTDPFSALLYEAADLTVFESYFLTFQFAVRHSLTSKAFSELLKVRARVHVKMTS